MTIRNEQDRTNTQKVDQSPKSEALSNGSSSVQSNLGGRGGGLPTVYHQSYMTFSKNNLLLEENVNSPLPLG